MILALLCERLTNRDMHITMLSIYVHKYMSYHRDPERGLIDVFQSAERNGKKIKMKSFLVHDRN